MAIGPGIPFGTTVLEPLGTTAWLVDEPGAWILQIPNSKKSNFIYNSIQWFILCRKDQLKVLTVIIWIVHLIVSFVIPTKTIIQPI